MCRAARREAQLAYTMIWILFAVAFLLIAAIIIRVRFGNIYQRGVDVFEARTGLSLRNLLLVAGGATLAAWLIIALTTDEAARTPLRKLFELIEPQPAPPHSEFEGQ